MKSVLAFSPRISTFSFLTGYAFDTGDNMAFLQMAQLSTSVSEPSGKKMEDGAESIM